jgi:dihydrofolate reductase
MQDVVYMFAMSLDGFIARPDGGIDWLDEYPPNADFDFHTFMSSVTGMVMGRDTYDVVMRLDHWPYDRIPTVVATRRPIGVLPDEAVAMAGTPEEMLESLRKRGAHGRIWLLGGGDLARQFIEHGLLDVVEIGTIPVILGGGVGAFGGLQPDRWLELDFAKPLANGALHSRYKVRDAQSAVLDIPKKQKAGNQNSRPS